MIRRVAIIGGGAAAATLLSELIDQPAPRPLHLDWYQGVDQSGRGVAYGTTSDRHLLNVRAASMGMFAGKPRGFLDFAQRHDPAVHGADFLPRRLYGDYLAAEVTRALEHADAQDQDVQVMAHEVDALVPEADGVTVICGETRRRADVAVLALGAMPPQPLPGVDGALLEDGRYVVDPWPFLTAVHADDAPREVALIGTGLTAVDVLLELSAQWPNACFTAFSRHGLFSETHLPQASAPDDDSAELVQQMIDAPDVRSWIRALREAVARAEDWRTVTDALRPHTPALWRELPPAERARYLRHARWAWERVRHRMPPGVAEQMHALEAQGRLRRQRGRMDSASAEDGRVRLALHTPRGESATLRVDRVIQTVGLNTDVRTTAHPLMRQLVTNGHVTPDPLGLGCQAMPDGRLCHDGKPWPNLFAMGTLLRGTLWETTAMPEIRAQARRLAERLNSAE